MEVVEGLPRLQAAGELAEGQKTRKKKMKRCPAHPKVDPSESLGRPCLSTCCSDLVSPSYDAVSARNTNRGRRNRSRSP